MKIEDQDQYRLGYAQGYYDAIKDINAQVVHKRDWAFNSLMAVVKDVMEGETNE